MSELLQTVEVNPPECDAAVVWLHGLGADGNDFVDLVPELNQPRTRFVFPHARMRAGTINGGYVMRAWYDITSITAKRIGQSEADIKTSNAEIHALIEREHARGIPYRRIVLAGFSQGGAMALYAGRRFPHTLAGILVLSAYELLPDARAESSAANAETPIFVAHGNYDPVVPVGLGRSMYEALAAESSKRPLQWRDYPMAHQVCLPQVRDIAAWLAARLPAGA